MAFARFAHCGLPRGESRASAPGAGRTHCEAAVSHAHTSGLSPRRSRRWNQAGIEASVETVSSCTRTCVLMHRSRCDQSANCSCAPPELPHTTGSSKRRLEFAKTPAPVMAIHSPSPLYATRFGGSWRIHPTGAPDPVDRIQENPPNSQNCRAFCRPWKSKTSARQSAPTAGSQGKAYHTPKATPWQEEPLPHGPVGWQAWGATRYGNCKGRSRKGSGPMQNGPSKASRIGSLAGVEPETPACICGGCILSRIEHCISRRNRPRNSGGTSALSRERNTGCRR